jgi:hypothetical protein
MVRRPALAVLAGVLSVGLPVLAVVVLALGGRDPIRRPRTDVGAPAAAVRYWDAGAQASVALVRRVTAHEARRAMARLTRCEGRAAGAAAALRNRRYRHCALRDMARTGGFARANSHQLETLAETGRPRPHCLMLLRELAGGTGQLAGQVHTLMLNWAAASWRELLASSRAVRDMARSTLQLARRAEWRAACRARRRPAPAPSRLVA